MPNHLINYVYIFLFISLTLIFQKVKSVSVYIRDELDLQNYLNNDKDSLTINISSNKKINIQNDIKIVNSIGKLKFVGTNGDTSVLNFINNGTQLYFTENVKEIEFQNLSIIGNLFFENNINVNFKSVSIFGSIDSNFDKYNEKVSFTNVNYQSSTISTDYCINLGGNVNINNSQFLGSSSCKLRLLNFNGLNKYNLDIKNSFFDGNYQCPCLKVDNGKNVNIYSSHFTRGYIDELKDTDLNCGGLLLNLINICL